jgi:hypothetical protein
MPLQNQIHRSNQALDLYYLSPPDPEAVARMRQRVEMLKQSMGEKYLLAKPLPRLENRATANR